MGKIRNPCEKSRSATYTWAIAQVGAEVHQHLQRNKAEQQTRDPAVRRGRTWPGRAGAIMRIQSHFVSATVICVPFRLLPDSAIYP